MGGAEWREVISPPQSQGLGAGAREDLSVWRLSGHLEAREGGHQTAPLRPHISQVWPPELGGPVDQVRAACCAHWPGGLSANGRWPVGLGLAGLVSGSLGVEFGNFLGGLEVRLELSTHLGSAWIGGVPPVGHQLLFPFPPCLADDGKLSLEEFQLFFADGVLDEKELEDLFHTIDSDNTK